MLGRLTQEILRLRVRVAALQKEWDELWESTNNDPSFKKWTSLMMRLEMAEDRLMLLEDELAWKGEYIRFSPCEGDEVERAKRLWKMALDHGWRVLNYDEYCGGEVLPRDLMHPVDAHKAMDEFYEGGCGLTFYPKIRVMKYGTW